VIAVLSGLVAVSIPQPTMFTQIAVIKRNFLIT
jgi:hypothetical protein